MQEPYWWYVLYVRANTEQRVASDVERLVKARALGYEIEPFCPESEYYYRRKSSRQVGKVYLKRPLFPGYLFIETNMPSAEFLREFSTYIYDSEDIVRILRQGASGEIALPTEERKRLEFLLKGKRYIEHSVGYIVGDKICIEYGPMRGMEGAIKRLDRHNRKATIEIDMFGTKTSAVVALELVARVESNEVGE